MVDHAPELCQRLALALEHEVDEPLAVVLRDLLEHERPPALIVGPDDTYSYVLRHGEQVNRGDNVDASTMREILALLY